MATVLYGRKVIRTTWTRAIAAAGVVLLSVLLWGFLPAFYGEWSGFESGFTGSPGPLEHSRMLLLPFILIVAILCARMIRENPRNAVILRYMMYPSRLVAYGSAYVSGYVLARLQSSPGQGVDGFAELLRIGSGLIGVWLLFLSAKFQNDITDLPADRISNPGRPLVTGDLSVDFVRQLAHLFWIASLLFMLPVAPNILLFWFSFAAIAYLYVSTHLNVRRIYPLGQASIAVLVITLFLAGAETAEADQAANMLLQHTDIIVVIFVIGFLLANMKDFRDMEGDRIAGYASLPMLVPDWVVSARILSVLIAAAILVLAYSTDVPLVPISIVLVVYVTGCLWMLKGKPDVHRMDRLTLSGLAAIVTCLLVFVYSRLC